MRPAPAVGERGGSSPAAPSPRFREAVERALTEATYPSSTDGRPRKLQPHHVAAFVPAVLRELAAAGLAAGAGELRLRKALAQAEAGHRMRSETLTCWKCGAERDEPHEASCIFAALAAPLSLDAEAVAALVALPRKMLEPDTLDMAEMRGRSACSGLLRAVLRRLGLEPEGTGNQKEVS
jgi:hypothetical protein